MDETHLENLKKFLAGEITSGDVLDMFFGAPQEQGEPCPVVNMEEWKASHGR